MSKRTSFRNWLNHSAKVFFLELSLVLIFVYALGGGFAISVVLMVFSIAWNLWLLPIAGLTFASGVYALFWFGADDSARWHDYVTYVNHRENEN